MVQDNPVPGMRTDLEIIPTQYQGQRAILVRDFLGLISNPILLQGDALTLISLLDGKRTVRDLQLALVRFKRGVFVSGESIENLVSELDAAFLLESEAYHRQKARILDDYLMLEVRSASYAGRSYPGRAKDLKLYLDALLAEAGDIPPGLEPQNIRGLVAPHIDLEIGKRVYAKAYGAIRNLSPKRIFLLGTGHSLAEGFFCLTEKDFESPLGLARTDKRVVQKLRNAGGKAVSPSDIAHRQEHSLEFQLIFLQHLFGAGFELVPVLCGSFSRELGRVSSPSEIPGVGNFLAALKAEVEASCHESLVAAGVDFSHIGPKFGQNERATSLLLEAKSHDQALIRALEGGNAGAFWAESKKTRDRYNVCGFSAMACLLEVLPGAKGRLLDYEFWREEPTQSAVSFAALVFTHDTAAE